jgi:NADP-dependent 3-hydroxy acid dehydrogenase YdfG
MELNGKVIVVTGAASGLGKALAIKLSEVGGKLALIDRDEQKLNELKQLEGAEVFVCDVSDHEQVQTTFKLILEKFYSIDVLVNNAGVWYEGLVENHPDKAVKDLFGSNAIGVINCTQQVLPLMRKANTGQILNTVSVGGLMGEPGWPVYVSTKHAIRGFTDSTIASLQGSNVKVMAIYPGGIDTNLYNAAGFPRNANESWMMKKEDVADVMVFMLTRPEDILMDHVEVKKIF